MAAAASPRVALVTGASSGLGLAIAQRLLADGWRVAVTGRSAERLLAAFADVAKDRLVVIESDLSTLEGVDATIAATIAAFDGRLNLLVNNAGSGMLGQFMGAAGTTAESFDAVMALNVRAPYLLINGLVKALVAAPRGVVINLSSIAASRPLAGLASYCLSKAAIESLTQTAALELAPRGVRVVAIAPATFATSFHTAAGMTPDVAARYYEGSAATHPLGRVGRPEEVAEAVAYLCDNERAGFITGSVLSLDGGRLLTLPMASGLVPTTVPAADSAPAAGSGRA